MSSISIIVPVYNKEKYLNRCLESLVNQTIKDIEIIIINDGSTDNSEAVIKEYLLTNTNIRYYSKENEGIAKTRNYGIELAKSDYILFVDADDYIENTLVEKLMPYIKQNVDLIKFKVDCVNQNDEVLEKIDGPVFDILKGNEAFNQLYCNDVLLDSPCVYIIKKDLFTRLNAKFKGTYHEDFGLIPLLIIQADSCVSTPLYLYHYIEADNSITRDVDYNKIIKRMDDALFHYDNAMKCINDIDIDITTKENAKIYYTNAVVLKIKDLKSEEQKKYTKELKKREVYKNIVPRNLKQLIKRIVLKFSIKLYLKMR